ncbi:MAG: HAD family phosphatase [Bdellovibrionales bacterium]|nr:HAD family phosphatase [Bdellovibrionales bacterium]
MNQVVLLTQLIDRFEAFLFDFDGVVVQSEKIKFKAYQSAFKLHLDIDIDDGEMKWVGLNEEDVVQFYFDRYRLKADKQKIIHSKREWYSDYQKNDVIPLTEGIENYLKKLKEREKKVGLVTSSKKSDVQIILQKHFGLDVFDVVVTAEDVKRRKPDPEGYLLAMRRLECKAQKTVVFEDSQYGIDAGVASGAKVVVVGMCCKKETSILVKNFIG